MRWTIEDGAGFVTVRTAGRFNESDHRAMVKNIVAQPFWRPGRDTFFDHRKLTFDGSSAADIGKAADTHRDHDAEIGDGRTALLMATLADYGMGRMFEGRTGDHIHAKLRVFLKEEEALRWLSEPAG